MKKLNTFIILLFLGLQVQAQSYSKVLIDAFKDENNECYEYRNNTSFKDMEIMHEIINVVSTSDIPDNVPEYNLALTVLIDLESQTIKFEFPEKLKKPSKVFDFKKAKVLYKDNYVNFSSYLNFHRLEMRTYLGTILEKMNDSPLDQDKKDQHMISCLMWLLNEIK